MSGRNRLKNAKESREGGGFVALPFVVIRSQSFATLSSHAVKLLFDLLAQYNGGNNGDLEMTWRTMRKRGWKSKDTLYKARDELARLDWIEVTRVGGLMHKATLYAVTFYAVNHCNGKLDVSDTRSPKSTWRRHEPVRPLKAGKFASPSPNTVPIES